MWFLAKRRVRRIPTAHSARAAFRLYWSLVSPGIELIRRISLQLVKKEAERRTRVTTQERLNIDEPAKVGSC